MQKRGGFNLSKTGEQSLPDRGTFVVSPVSTDDTDKAQAREECARDLELTGNLTQREIEEFVGYEFDIGPESVADQVRRYYLMVKRDAPDRAKSFLEKIGEIKADSDLGYGEVISLCADIREFVSGSVIRHDGILYGREVLLNRR